MIPMYSTTVLYDIGGTVQYGQLESVEIETDAENWKKKTTYNPQNAKYIKHSKMYLLQTHFYFKPIATYGIRVKYQHSWHKSDD